MSSRSHQITAIGWLLTSFGHTVRLLPSFVLAAMDAWVSRSIPHSSA